jgi:hypothetical protein
MNTERIAFDLLACLHEMLGCMPEIEQVHCVDCEDGSSVMLYIYLTGGGECYPLCIDSPQLFDAQVLEAALLTTDGQLH